MWGGGEFFGKKFVGNDADSKLFYSGTGSVFGGLQDHVDPDPKLFYLLLYPGIAQRNKLFGEVLCLLWQFCRRQRKFVLVRIRLGKSFVHDSDPGNGCGTMRIRIQTMLIGYLYSEL